MAMISIFPHAPQMLVKMVDLLAMEMGEPSGADIRAAVKDYSLADVVSYSLDSIERFIYKSRSRRASPSELTSSSLYCSVRPVCATSSYLHYCNQWGQGACAM